MALTVIKSQVRSKTGQIRELRYILMSLTETGNIWTWHQRSFSFDQIFINFEVSYTSGGHTMFNGIKLARPDRVLFDISHVVPNMQIFDLDTYMFPFVLIKSFWNFQTNRTGMESRAGSKTGQFRYLNLKLFFLECWNWRYFILSLEIYLKF